MSFASCNNFSGKVILDRTTQPYSVVCSGYNFVGNGLQAQKVTPQKIACVENVWDDLSNNWSMEPLFWDAPGCFLRNFMEERTPFLNGEICSSHPLADIEFERVQCLNRFGGALHREVGNPSNIREVYDKSCIGYRTSGTNGAPLTNKWETNSEGFYRGQHIGRKISIPGGQCVGTEPDFQFTKNADPVNCQGFAPCFELLTVSCNFDGSPSTPSDPTCNLDNLLPDSLFQDTFFCSTNPLSLGQRRNVFCSTNSDSLRYRVKSVKFCDINIANKRLKPKKIGYCNTEIENLRVSIGKLKFCEFNPSFIRETIVIQEAQYCEQDNTALLPQITKLNFCSTIRPIAKIKYCEFNPKSLRNIEFVEYCEHDSEDIRISVDKTQYCDQNQISTLLFSNQRRQELDAVDDVAYCDFNRNTIDGANKVSYCQLNSSGLRNNGLGIVQYCDSLNIPNLLFSNQERKILDNIVDVSFCTYNRREIDAVEDVSYCSYDRTNIDGATKLAYCLTDRKEIDGATIVSYCSQDRFSIIPVDKVSYCDMQRDQTFSIKSTNYCEIDRNTL